MADSVETATDTAETEVTAPKPGKQKSLARVQAVPWLIVILLIAATVWLFWRAFIFQEEGDPVGSAMLAFEKQNSLTVFSSRFEVTAESTNTTSLGPIDLAESRQAAIIPATIDYRVNLASVGRDRIAWDADTETMDITLPVLKISKPNLDEARKKVYTEGVWVSRGASENLSRENSLQAEQKAAAFAKNPEVLALARQAAKDAITQNLTIPLQVAGYDDITVNVRFDGEKVSE
ncbi:DUF4230 domain-containing protein [Pontixanthobacter sp. CEM42]|uniref:DUF4230 domain-containing protein n=1 Tax=Pontixanthobacter sp. CEM42 TaxID=2792077 RepID=UPI001ADFD680|nr:DUF4230 domain-containing protein [Pontixanthobacter sp. CEM42]